MQRSELRAKRWTAWRPYGIQSMSNARRCVAATPALERGPLSGLKSPRNRPLIFLRYVPNSRVLRSCIGPIRNGASTSLNPLGRRGWDVTDLGWTQAGAAMAAAFLASLVEFIEALTVVLAV